MTLIHSASELNPAGRKVCLAIGFFDGVHLGHQQIIRQTLTDARQHEAIALAITFDGHPNTVVAPDRVPPLIYSLPQKLRAIEALGVDTTLVIHFDKPFSEQTGESFLRALAHDLSHSTDPEGSVSSVVPFLNSPTLNSLCVGSNFVFGHKRGGNVALLKKLGKELNFTVHGLAAVSLDGKPVSSTRIREAIVAGDLDAASQMLGRAYSLAGTVIRGDRLGHELGFPTANIDVTGLALPPNGIYAAQVWSPGFSRSGPATPSLAAPKSDEGGTLAPRPSPLALFPHRAVLNIGTRPTLKNPKPELRVEAHLLDFDGDLYGQELEIIFVEKLRDEKKFPSLNDLRAQIGRDIEDAQTRF